MARVIRQTPLEIYVKDYLKSTNTKFKSNFDLLRKAAVYIQEKIDNACCDEDAPIINLFTRKDSQFVHNVYTILFGMSRRGNIQSLQRAHDAIINYITPPCCFENTTLFALTGPTGDTHSDDDPYGLVSIATVTGPYAQDITHIDFYVDSTLISVSLVNPATGLLDIDNPVSAGVPHTYYWIAYTDAGTHVQSATRTFNLINP